MPLKKSSKSADCSCEVCMSEIEALKSEIAALKKALSGASKGGKDQRVDLLVKYLFPDNKLSGDELKKSRKDIIAKLK
jgi:hypothetical protein